MLGRDVYVLGVVARHMSGFSEELLRAYLQTEFCFSVPEHVDCRLVIGEACPELAALMIDGAGTAAVLTAFNPRSQPTAVEDNADAQRALRADLEDGGWTIFEGAGRGRTGEWPPEPSFLVIGISFGDAGHLAAKFGQNAIAFSGLDGIPRLVIGF